VAGWVFEGIPFLVLVFNVVNHKRSFVKLRM